MSSFIDFNLVFLESISPALPFPECPGSGLHSPAQSGAPLPTWSPSVRSDPGGDLSTTWLWWNRSLSQTLSGLPVENRTKANPLSQLSMTFAISGSCPLPVPILSTTADHHHSLNLPPLTSRPWSCSSLWLECPSWSFFGPVIKDPPCSAQDTGSIPGN